MIGDPLKVLKARNEFGSIHKMLVKLPDWKDETHFPILNRLLRHALSPPPQHECLTGSERRALATKISRSCHDLADALTKIHDWKSQWPTLFDHVLRKYALSTATELRELALHSGEDNALAHALEDTNSEGFRSAVAGIHFATREKIHDALYAIGLAADVWGQPTEGGQVRPNHKQAARARFIPKLNEGIFVIFGEAPRALTHALTSVFFDATGLDEAAISRAAPITPQMQELHELMKSKACN